MTDADISDLFVESRNSPLSGIFGGIIGQLWIILDVI